MLVSDLLATIQTSDDYINHSLYLKSSDSSGCVYKYLTRIQNELGTRKEIFIELDENESQLAIEDKTVKNYIEVVPAH
jgi:hypothetical protein